jgi:hypothetical protein
MMVCFALSKGFPLIYNGKIHFGSGKKTFASSKKIKNFAALRCQTPSHDSSQQRASRCLTPGRKIISAQYFQKDGCIAGNESAHTCKP